MSTATTTQYQEKISGRGLRASLAVWLVSVVILSLSAIPFTQPGYMDAYYYYHVAANIADGRGLVEDYIWNYLPPPDTVSHPSNLYWMPLTSLAMVPFFATVGESFRVSQVPVILFASLLVVLTFRLGIRFLGNFRHALAASALTLFSGFYFAYWTSPDSFALFALSANLVLLFGYVLLSRTDLSLTRRCGVSALAGGFAALSHLARADGALLLVVAMAMIGLGALRTGHSPPSRGRRMAGAMAVGVVCIMAYALVMFPWFLRNWQIIGSILPMAGAKTLFLQEYNDFYSYNKDLGWQSYLSWGLWPIAKSKIEALGSSALVLFGMEYHLIPFSILGLWHLRRKTLLLPFVVYAVALYLIMALLFTFPSGRGSMLHSSAALLPWLSLAAVVGLDRSVVLAARRLRHWKVPLAQRNFTLVLVFFAVVFSGFLLIQEAGKRNERYQHYNDIAAWLQSSAPPDALVMIADPPGFFYSSGKGSIVIPSDDLNTVLLLAKRYGASYLILEKVHSRPLRPYYDDQIADSRLQKAAEIGTTKIFRIAE